MKLSKKLLKALVEQVNMEFASGYLYRSMSHDMKNLALNGYAKWLDKQYEEEREHALKLIDYIEDRDGTVDFLPIEGVKKHWRKISVSRSPSSRASLTRLRMEAETASS